jgi:chromosome segregation ATPase
VTADSHGPAPETPEAGGEVWRVRTEDGATFGPVPLAALVDWARDGRLAPTCEISSDSGRQWLPVTRLAALAMHWVVEVAPGTFYGPVHREAIEELVREGALAADLPLFTRAREAADDIAALRAEKESLGRRLEELRHDFAARTVELERQFRAAAAAAEQLRGQLEAKDLDFEAERQEHRAAASRQQAERARLEARCSAIEKQQQETARQDAARLAAAARLPDLEKQLAAAGERLAAMRTELETELRRERQARREAEKALLEARAAQAGRRNELRDLRENLRALKLRQESLRKLLRQAVATLGGEETRAEPPTETVIENGVAVAAEEAVPPRAGLSLHDLEAQAQRELRRLGGRGQAPFQRK